MVGNDGLFVVAFGYTLHVSYTGILDESKMFNTHSAIVMVIPCWFRSWITTGFLCKCNRRTKG